MTTDATPPAATPLRSRYRALRSALPWLDVCACPDEPAAFPVPPGGGVPESVPAATAEPGLDPAALRAQGTLLLRVDPAKASLKDLAHLLPALEAARMPLAVRHTDVDFDHIEQLAGDYPGLPVILESGDQKLLYHGERIMDALRKHAGLYLCSYNFVNWMGHENLLAAGLGERLLFGTHAPLYAPDVAMAPIIMGDFDWSWKSALAGNNLRRLLGLPERHPPALTWEPPAPFTIDAHTHNLQPGSKAVYGFVTPDLQFSPADWIRAMDRTACAAMILIPGEALLADDDAQALSAGLRRYAPGRFAYMTIFDPRRTGAAALGRLERHLQDPECAAIKIHPSSHKTEADHPSYETAYRLARRYRKPIMTHSWDVSPYNPVQYMSHPDRFRPHLERYPDVTLVLGHAGGRPGAFEATVKVCRDFANVQVDFAGDYYHQGVLDAFAERIGSRRMLFASDVDWFDPRCSLGLFLGSRVSDEALQELLRGNARRIYCNA